MGIRQRAQSLLWENPDEVAVIHKLIGAQPATMLDVGAHYGNSLAPFLASGWSVYAFEPDPANRQVLSQRYPAAIIDSRAVSEIDGEAVSLFTSEISTGISSLSPFHASHAATTTVTTVRLDTYIRENGIERVDFLKTDVEGFDLSALRTFPWDALHPRAVVCEYEDRKTVPLGHDVHELARFLRSKGYAVMVSEWDPIVEYGRTHHWRRFVNYPADIPQDGWGNLIAVDPDSLPDLQRESRRTQRRLQVNRRLRCLLDAL